MKRNLMLLVLVNLILFSLVGAGSLVLAQPPGDPDAANPGETITGLIAFDNVFVYVGPDFPYDIIGQLPVNASVVVTGRRGDFISRWDGNQWVRIQFGGRQGWVYGRLVRTSIPFNSIPPTGRPLPRDNNGRVPDGFDLSRDVCEQWVGGFGQSGDIAGGRLTVTYPTLRGANLYTVIAISPSGFQTPFFSTTGSATIELDRLPTQGGTYTWRVAPYWTNSTELFNRQQVCLLRTGGTFSVPSRETRRASSESQPVATPQPGQAAPAAPEQPVPTQEGGSFSGGS
ncbi:MAG: SH3 domain-containing protein [bacterium]|nr:SH3 domain-containing protein [bacterium]